MRTNTRRSGPIRLFLAPALLSAALLACPSAALAAPPDDKPPPSYAERVAQLERRDGLIPLLLDRDKGAVYFDLPAPDAAGLIGEYLYIESLVTGLGSNPVGLDRGQLGDTRVVDLREVGGRVFMEQQNLGFRALTDNPAEQRAVRESFAPSALWAGEIEARSDDGRLLVDATPFVVRDAHGAARTLKSAGQGSFHLDADRSAVDLAACLAFPDNIVLDALLTFASDEPGPLVRAVAATPEAITLTQRHMLVRLPDAGYAPRRFDPRMASFPIEFADYSAALNKPVETRWIARHRLEKTNPAAARSRVKKPIVYYVDPGAPEPVRSALVEGASWWAAAFDAAGFIDAFRVEVAPPDMSPLDVRYNYIEWVHRSTRGWSYGGSIADPRTGEILKGHVSLGSLRVRQDRLIFEGLVGADQTGSGGPDDPVQIALARIRQLAAHEVGHTLGFAHNFAASAYGDRASVMDYPAPVVQIRRDGSLDFSRAYGVGVGAWDTLATRFAYSQFPPGADEQASLDAIVRQALRDGMIFLTDADARPAGAAHPLASLWDNGADPVRELEQVLRVRLAALNRFGERNIAKGEPLSLLQETLAPVYLFHRYQLEAAIKSIGGVRYRYTVRGDGQPPASPVDSADQRRALKAALEAVDPATLDLPESVVQALPPRAFSYSPNREMFASATAPTFDFLGAAATAADLALSGLLQPQRAARLIEQHARNPGQPDLREVIDALTEALFNAPQQEPPRRTAIRFAVQDAAVARMIDLADERRATGQTIAVVDDALADLLERLDADAESDDLNTRAHARRLLAEISRHLDRPHAAAPAPADAADAPPGQPIGGGWLGACSDDWFAPLPGR